MCIINLYEDIKKYMDDESMYDDQFYEAPEGDAQIEIVRNILEELLLKLC